MVGVSVLVAPPYASVNVEALKETPVTATLAAETVTAQVAVLAPSAVVTVIVLAPTATGKITPELFTVAIAVLLLVHVTFVLVALLGVIVAVKEPEAPPTAKFMVEALKETLDTETVDDPPLEGLDNGLLHARTTKEMTSRNRILFISSLFIFLSYKSFPSIICDFRNIVKQNHTRPREKHL
jgi:hypothetical protein